MLYVDIFLLKFFEFFGRCFYFSFRFDQNMAFIPVITLSYFPLCLTTFRPTFFYSSFKFHLAYAMLFTILLVFSNPFLFCRLIVILPIFSRRPVTFLNSFSIFFLKLFSNLEKFSLVFPNFSQFSSFFPRLPEIFLMSPLIFSSVFSIFCSCCQKRF